MAEAVGETFMMVSPSGDALLDKSVEFLRDVHNGKLWGDLFGFKRNLEGVYLDNDGQEVPEYAIVASALQGLLANVYLAGRWDQISDCEDSNERRTVRARDLPGVIGVANTARGQNNKIDATEVLGAFDHYRGLLDTVTKVTVSSTKRKELTSRHPGEKNKAENLEKDSIGEQ